MQKSVRKKLELYSIAAHEGPKAASYADVFNVVLTSSPESRTLEQGDRVVVLIGPERIDGKIAFKVYEGDRSLKPLIYNPDSNSERPVDLRGSEVVVNTTHVVVDVGERLAAIEYNHRGAKARDVEELLNSVYRRENSKSELILRLSPVPDGSFVEAINKFDRIHDAGLVLTKPNPSWGDREQIMVDLAGESEGDEVGLTVKSTHKGGLAKKKGIVQIIKNLANEAHSTLRSAFVNGYRPDVAGMLRVTLEQHSRRTRVDVPVDADGNVVTQAMNDQLVNLINDSS